MSARVLLLTACFATVGCFRGFDATVAGPAAPTDLRVVDRADGAIPTSPTIPEGRACLALLDGLGVPYRPLAAKRGIETPIEVEGQIAGVRYHTWGKTPLVMSCRLAVALTWIGPILTAHGVTEIRHSGAYVYRTSRKTGRLSLHAHGLAIDLHAFSFSDRAALSVQRGYATGQADPCSSTVLNHLACDLATTGLFRELLTPDRDADHHDHFHLAIAPIGQGRSTPATSEPPPKLAQARRRARPAKHRYPQGR